MILKPRLFRKPRKGHWATKGLVGLWLFNEGPGNTKVFDLSGNGIIGTKTGAIWKPAKFGSGIDFIANTDTIVFSPLPTVFTSRFTIIIWYKGDTILAADDNNLFTDWTSEQLFLTRIDTVSSKIACFTKMGSGGDTQYGGDFTGSTITLNAWEQIVFVNDGVKLKAYINAILSGTDFNVAGTFSQSATTVTMGDENDTGLDGKIDHVMIFNRALSASEISQLYLNPFCMFERDPIELWVGATSVGVPPVGMAGAMTTNSGYWGW